MEKIPLSPHHRLRPELETNRLRKHIQLYLIVVALTSTCGFPFGNGGIHVGLDFQQGAADIGGRPAEVAGFAVEVEVGAGVVGADGEEGGIVAGGAGGGGGGEVFADDVGGSVAGGKGVGEAGFAGVEGDVGCVGAGGVGDSVDDTHFVRGGLVV